MWLLIMLISVGFLGWLAFSMILPFVLPLEKAGRDVLQRELMRNEVLASVVPEQFYVECIAASIEKLHSVRGGKWTQRMVFVQDLKLTADTLHQWLRDPSSEKLHSLDKHKECFNRHFDRAK